MSALDRITLDPQVMGGKPCIRGLRMTVVTVLGLLADGATREQILADYPYLEGDDIQAALAFAAWRATKFGAPLTADAVVGTTSQPSVPIEAKMPFVLEIPDDVLDALRFPQEEIDREPRTELAVALFARGALSMGKAVTMSRLSRWAFEDVLVARKVERPFTEAEVEHDRDFVNRTAPVVRLG